MDEKILILIVSLFVFSAFIMIRQDSKKNK